MNTPPSTSLSTILSWFQTGSLPTEEQFTASWSAFRHKNDAIPADQISGLSNLFQQTATAEALNTHIADSNAHAGVLAKLDATNLNTVHRNAWRSKLGVGDIPANVALVDQDQDPSVYNKAQINALTMLLSDFVQNGKIRADKIESLGLTELITATETSLSDFVAASGNYTFEKNDFIALPINGNYSLFMFKGGDKKTAANYLPTGLTNITISMVEGLQTALNSKLDKPSGTGNYFVRQNGSVTSFAKIEPSSYYLTLFNGNDFVSSNAYFTNNKIGLGTQTPTEMLHLNDGRIRAKAAVFDENTESLPNQITLSNRRFMGSDLTGMKRTFMYRDYDDLHTLFSGMNDSQKLQLRNDLRLSNENFSTGTPRIDVLLLPFIDNTKNFTQYTTLVGINLFVDNITPNAAIKIKRIKDIGGNNLGSPEVYAIDSFTVLQNFPNNLNFGMNWSDKPEGYYQIFVTHNGLTNASSPELIVKAGLQYSQFLKIANWQITSGSGASIDDTTVSAGVTTVTAQTDNLISISDINKGFMVSFSVNNALGNIGANFVSWWQCGLTGADNVFYGVQYNGVSGEWRITNGPELNLTRNDTIHIAYYNGVVYVIAEGNGRTYQQFNSTFNLYPKKFVFVRNASGAGSLSMNLIGKILLT